MIEKEIELHAPVSKWLEEKGCDVQAEVNSVDLVGLLGNEVVVAVELKKKLNLEVINQAVERQKYASLTYIAVEHDYKSVESKRFKMTKSTLRRLKIGLLTVNFRSEIPLVYEQIKAEVMPEDGQSKRGQKLKNQLIKEFRGRKSGHFNKGGSVKTQVMTAYKETCLKLAWIIHQEGQMSTKAIRSQFPDLKSCTSYLNANHYRWFQRVERGVYRLTQTGEEALNMYPYVIEFFERQLKSDADV